MESQRRLYFKKQIVKELSQQKTEVPASGENENSKNNEADKDCVVTLLGSQSYYDQIQKFAFVTTISSNSNVKKESQNDHASTTKALLEDITNKDLTKEKSYKENYIIEDIRIDIEFESTENTEGVWSKESSSDTFPQKENGDDELTFKNEKNDKEKEPELISTLTEVIAESEMELLRKSLEADEDDIETENNNDTNDDQVKSKKRNKRNKTTNEKNVKENEPELISTLTEVIAEGDMELLRKSLEADENDIEAENNKSKKKNKRSKINKSYFDYLSEEEDFVWDSSSWKETGCCSGSCFVPQNGRRES